MKDGILEVNKIGNVPVIVDLIPVSNKTSRPRYAMKPTFITIHNTGNSKKGANAKMHTEYVDTAKGYISWHFTVDDKQIFQELPLNETGWHAGDGDGCGNMKSIGIEICENDGVDWYKAKYNALQLITFLMKECNISIYNVVPHQHWSGKYCPHLILDEGWDLFISDVGKMAKSKDNKPSPWAIDAVKWAKENGISDGTNLKANCTREQVITMLYRANKLNGGK